MAIPGYISPHTGLYSPPSDDKYYDPAIGLPYFSADNIPEDFDSAKKISSHDWVVGTYPPMFRFIRDGQTYLFFGGRAVSDIELLLRASWKDKPVPDMLTPVLHPGWDPAYNKLVPSFYKHRFTEEEWFDNLCVDLCYGLTSGPKGEESGYVYMGYPIEKILELENVTDNHEFSTHLWDYPRILNYFKALYKWTGRSIRQAYAVAKGIPYVAVFVYTDGTRSKPSTDVLGYGLPLWISQDPGELTVYWGHMWGCGTLRGDTTYFDLAVQYIPIDVVSVQYFRYVYFKEGYSNYPAGEGWRYHTTVPASDNPFWR